MNRFTPFAVSVPIALTILLVLWCFSCGIDYSRGDSTLQSLRTAGWYFLGFPVNVGIAILVAWLFATLVRTKRTIAVAIASFALGALTVSSVRSVTPQNRLASIIGPEAATQVEIERLLCSDSFGDGSMTQGVLSGNERSINAIAAHRNLRPAQIVPTAEFAPVWPNQRAHADRIPREDDDLYAERGALTDGRSMFYFHELDSRIYFWKRGG